MTTDNRTPNKLINEKSPYLLQHAYNPIDWFPWGQEAFQKAKSEDKPIFLSIGYSTCHWCHVMAHESFEDAEIADILNQYFVSIKVDKEERPDIDSVYMSFCQTFTGGAGWPMSIFMTSDQKPFFAGTYFPKSSSAGSTGFKELLFIISERWKSENDKQKLIESAEGIAAQLRNISAQGGAGGENASRLADKAYELFKSIFDNEYGGFGYAPKFPSPHNLMFLMEYNRISGKSDALSMVEKTLTQMYRGGIFDHIGYGFSRYSTDGHYLVPHFEKMLYDNALLIISYAQAYESTKNIFYKNIAEKTAEYVLREMTSPEGGFYSAQDADSDGEEGKYYVFEPYEIINILGQEAGNHFNDYYGIKKNGNFEGGRSIPNLLDNNNYAEDAFKDYLPEIYQYRKARTKLHLDDKILTAWNSIMISAFAMLYQLTENEGYLYAARKAEKFIDEKLFEDGTLYVSFRDGSRGAKGYLDDYAFYAFALMRLYDATLDTNFINKARRLCDKAISDFFDMGNGGFYLYGKENEELIITPKEIYDGAIPSGNSVMAYNLIKLSYLTNDTELDEIIKKQLLFISSGARKYPSGHCFFLLALMLQNDPPETVTAVLKNKSELAGLRGKFGQGTIVRIVDTPTDEYRLINDKTTFYVCKNHVCMNPINDYTQTSSKLRI